MPEIKEQPSGVQVVLGFLLGGALNLLVLGAGLLVSRLPGSSAFGSIGLFGLVFFGVAQLIWQVPVV